MTGPRGLFVLAPFYSYPKQSVSPEASERLSTSCRKTGPLLIFFHTPDFKHGEVVNSVADIVYSVPDSMKYSSW
jgi:hypothetical protein